jgi:hypothetical protein
MANNLVQRGYALASECDPYTKGLIHVSMSNFQKGLSADIDEKPRFFEVANHIMNNAFELMFQYVDEKTLIETNDNIYKKFNQLLYDLKCFL